MPKQNERQNGAQNYWPAFLVIAVLLFLGLLTFWGWIPAGAATNSEDAGNGGEEAGAVVYDQAYADSVCAETGVNSFNPQTGEVVCMVELANNGPVATEPAVVQSTQVPPAASDNTTSSEACLPLDKIGTWSENPQGLVHRIEVGGHGGQHMDFYPEVGVKAISYIVGEITPPEVAAIWWGYGSNWEGNPPGCTFDWIADATAYAEARLDSGHSGLVVDWRSGEPVVVANVAGLNQAQIDALLEQHYAAMDTTP